MFLFLRLFFIMKYNFMLSADCIISYVDTIWCNCATRTYKRQIRCTEPDVTGGVACPAKCKTGDLVVGWKSCSWDHMDEAFCAHGNKEKPLTTVLVAAFLLVK